MAKFDGCLGAGLRWNSYSLLELLLLLLLSLLLECSDDTVELGIVVSLEVGLVVAVEVLSKVPSCRSRFLLVSSAI